MTEPVPQTRSSLVRDFRALGVRPGTTLLLHASLRSLGWVCGGAPTVVRALLDVLGAAGTLVVPAFTRENRDPSRWSHVRVPEAWWPAIRAELPAFDPAVTPCRELGLIAETVRTWPNAFRSSHPQTSFAAVGFRARELTARHPITSEIGPDSPLGAIEAAGGETLLLGVGYDRCTAFHLAEYRLPGLGRRPNRCVVLTPEGRRWTTYQAAALDDRDFVELGRAFELTSANAVRIGNVGAGTARLLPITSAVTFATTWLPRHRQASEQRASPN
ncbi:aminoglycoside N(3)-acetyltransferase [Plantactinospora soyae]|uniref:Aminoglycoside N(3)-acetyltransferase n=1 Tax=Plantactinospora soyae TaxID=1544732 RepID=A0A927M2P0_9ACTN|nr:AAC(3) family N-acetyltransferase [Plantactinospora soyae]MBE1486967.1 aminoglycoside 3-N-acetyltransferase [Plantactinospora soyae]